MDYIFQIWNDVMYKINTEKNSIEKTRRTVVWYYYSRV